MDLCSMLSLCEPSRRLRHQQEQLEYERELASLKISILQEKLALQERRLELKKQRQVTDQLMSSSSKMSDSD